MPRNLRGLYIKFEHDRPADWSFLSQWQPSVVRLMVDGNHTDPNSISIDRIKRLHDLTGARILIRCWDVDDRRGEGNPGVFGELQADPRKCAENYHAFWARFMDRLPGDLRDACWAGSINEPLPDLFPQTFDFTGELLNRGTQDGVGYGVFMFSTGTPPKPDEHLPWGWQKFAVYDDAIADGGHVAVCHEYMQPEGMYAVWTDEQGNRREDYGNLIGRHLVSGLKRAPLIIGEWGIDGILYNRHPDPAHGGHNGWLGFRELWGPERYADEYVECVRQAAANVIAICPFASDIPDENHTWNSFDVMPAYGALLSRKRLCVRDDAPPEQPHTTFIPVITQPAPDTPTAADPEPQPAPVETHLPGGIIDPRVAEAVMQVESGNEGFDADGSLKIRVEAHLLLNPAYGNPAVLSGLFRAEPGDYWHGWMLENGQWVEYHALGQAGEWAAFSLAASLDRAAALRCTSMGASQVMGFNHAKIGYATPEQMYRAFSRSVDMHALGFFNYCLATPGMVAAINARDWPTIGALYNGSASAGEKYRAAYAALWGES